MGGSDTETYQQPDIKETEQFWTKIWQPKKHNEMLNGYTILQENKRDSKKVPKWKYTSTYSKQHEKEYQTGKRQAMMEYMDFGSRNSPPFTAD